ncbi:10833_t:CDS:2 [Paraglomus brasilianum]|uniref:10833_t:CDS:1 n=1 Tax=Paraglomus brasilianum TaxID=144538 RepID=A0A9N9GPW0_9GLOM|nr:10833_t:CDS:2 [Paraglomus brasilianum]
MFLGEYLDYVQKFYTHPSDRLRGLLYGKYIWPKNGLILLIVFFRYNGKNNMMAYIPTKTQNKESDAYIGVERTRTSTHKDMCAALGIISWFMLKSIAQISEGTRRNRASRGIWLEEVIKTKWPITWTKYRFGKIFYPRERTQTEQRIGDFVLVPSNSCHQNVGLTLQIPREADRERDFQYEYEIVLKRN